MMTILFNFLYSPVSLYPVTISGIGLCIISKRYRYFVEFQAKRLVHFTLHFKQHEILCLFLLYSPPLRADKFYKPLCGGYFEWRCVTITVDYLICVAGVAFEREWKGNFGWVRSAKGVAGV